LELLPSTQNKTQSPYKMLAIWLLAEGAEAAINIVAQHNPPTTFWLYQGTPSFIGAEILLAWLVMTG